MMAPRLMFACRPPNDKRASVARRTVQPRQLDLFRAPRRKQPFTPEKLAAMAIGIFNASGPVAGTPGQRFLTCAASLFPARMFGRFHPRSKHGDERSPGLIFLLRDLHTDAPCGIMRVFLDTNGWPIAKKVLGRAWGASISRAPRPP